MKNNNKLTTLERINTIIDNYLLITDFIVKWFEKTKPNITHENKEEIKCIFDEKRNFLWEMSYKLKEIIFTFLRENLDNKEIVDSLFISYNRYKKKKYILESIDDWFYAFKDNYTSIL